MSPKKHHSFYQPRHATGKWKPKRAFTTVGTDNGLYDAATTEDEMNDQPQNSPNALYEAANG